MMSTYIDCLGTISTMAKAVMLFLAESVSMEGSIDALRIEGHQGLAFGLHVLKWWNRTVVMSLVYIGSNLV